MRASEKPSIAAAICAIEFVGDQPRIAAEQCERDDRHGRPRRLGSHVANARRPTSAPSRCTPLRRTSARCASTAAGEKLAATIRRCSRQSSPSDVSRPRADDRIEQRLDDVGLRIIGRIVEQHMLDQVRVEQDMDTKAEDVALEIADLERPLRPAIDRRPRPLAEKAAPGCYRLVPAAADKAG